MHVSAESMSKVNEEFTEKVDTSPFEGLQTVYVSSEKILH